MTAPRRARSIPRPRPLSRSVAARRARAVTALGLVIAATSPVHAVRARDASPASSSSSAAPALTCPAPLFRSYDPSPRFPAGPPVAFVAAFPYVDVDAVPPATRLVLYAVRMPGARDADLL